MAAVSTLPAEELPFLAEICAAPDDDGPRLVFADWLEERGDVRGEMLRVGCALARLELDDPQYDALAAREMELREPCRTEWLARLPQPKGLAFVDQADPPSLEGQSYWPRGEELSPFQRGLLEKVMIHEAPGIQGCRTLIESYGVREVCLADVIGPPVTDPLWNRIHAVSALGPGDRAPLWRSRQLGALLAIRFALPQHLYEDLQSLAANPAIMRLRDLRIIGSLNDDVLTLLREWPHEPLRKVYLREFALERPSGATPAGVIKWLVSPAASGLEWLELHRLEFGPLAHIALGSANLRALRRLFLSHAGLQRATPEALATLAGLPNLEWLCLAHNQLGDGALAALAPSLHADLRRLDLEDNRLGAKGTGPLAEANLTGLRRLRLADNRLNDEAAIQLAASPQLAGLVELDLFENQIGDKGALALAESPHLTSLKRLDLFNNPIRRTYTRECLTERFGAGVSLSPT